MGRRNSAVTRQAILDSAIREFTRAGYDGVGVRAIAEGAGVTAMLVNRYFGSKEALFAEAAEVSLAPRTIVGENVARRLVERTAPDAETLDPFELLLRSAPNPRAAEVLRAATERHVVELSLSLIAGIWLLRRVLATTALAGADANELERRIQAMLEAAARPDAATDA